MKTERKVQRSSSASRRAKGTISGSAGRAAHERNPARTPARLRKTGDGRERPFDILEELPVYTVLLSEDYHVRFANRFFRERFGEDNGRRCFEYLFDRSTPCEICESLIPLQTKAPHRWQWTGPDGRDYDIYDYPVQDQAGARMVLETGVDVTERNRVERALRESEEKFKYVFDHAVIGNSLTLPDGRLQPNAAFCHMLGYSLEELRGLRWQDLTLEDDIVRAQGELAALLAGTKDSTRFVARLVRKDGSVMWADLLCSLRRGNDGQPLYFMASISDITDRILAQQDAQRANAYNRSLIEASLDPLVTIGPDGKITDVNQATELATGLRRTQLIGTDFSNYFTEPEKARAGYKRVLSEGFVRDYPLTIQHASGAITHVLYHAVVYRNEAGEVQGVFAAARDVTELRQAEERVREASSYNRRLLEASIDPLVAIGPDGKITDVNRATELATGVARAGLIGSDFSDYFTEPEKAREGYQLVLADGVVRDYPLTIRGASGKTTHVLYNATVYENGTGAVAGVFAAARDITARRAAENEIRRLNQELEARVIQRTSQLEAANKELEAFAYSVSHDLRSPLRHISGYIELLQKKLETSLDDQSLHYLTSVADSAGQMGTLIDDLLDFSRMGRTEMEHSEVDLGSLVAEAIKALQAETGGRSIRWEVATLPTVHGDRAMLRVVLINLLSNALKFTRHSENARIEIGSRMDDPAESVIFVRDNGVGFDMAYVDKLFNVFQRLHRTDEFEGTGIGLASVQRIINRHGGRTWAEGRLGEGATFYFSLPIPPGTS